MTKEKNQERRLGLSISLILPCKETWEVGRRKKLTLTCYLSEQRTEQGGECGREGREGKIIGKHSTYPPPVSLTDTSLRMKALLQLSGAPLLLALERKSCPHFNFFNKPIQCQYNSSTLTSISCLPEKKRKRDHNGDVAFPSSGMVLP